MSSDAVSAAFENVDVEAVASEHSVGPERLASLVAAHQEGMAKLPGVENLVYEWRKQFDATVIARTQREYLVDAPEWAWEEFADGLDADADEMAALAAVHERAVAAHADTPADVEDATPMVLVRE